MPSNSGINQKYLLLTNNRAFKEELSTHQKQPN